jgi:hypothetical protein
LRFEQAVYGSFPFWDKGYAVLAQSPGCRPEWLHELRVACQRYGEPPRGTSAAGALFSLRLPSGPWAIVGVSAPGLDDQGRPGALAFHALFLTRREFRKVHYDPFALAGALRRDWGPETRSLTAGVWTTEPARDEPIATADVWTQRVVATLVKGRKLAIERTEPIEPLAGAVWSRLPARVRRRASVATLAFSAANPFDLVAFPRLAAVTLDPSYLINDPMPPPTAPARGKRYAAVAVALLLVAGLFGWGLYRWIRDALHAPGVIPPRNVIASETDQGAPDRAAYIHESVGAEERAQVNEALVDLAEQSGIAEPGLPGSGADPTALMVLLADRLHYRGPVLSAVELAALEREDGPDRDRALAWHGLVQRYRADRRLPPNFATGPLRWQLDTLAWSFHVEPMMKQSAAEVPHALGRELAVAVSTRPNPLAARYPALAAYARFLGQLPRR